MFLTSKLWNTDHHPDQVRNAILVTLNNLNTPYLDLYLMHMPCAFQEGTDLFPTDENGQTLYSDVDYIDTWREMENAVDDGLVRSIGISNFNYRQTKRLLENCRIRPVTNQIECHPYLAQQKLDEYLRSQNIILTAYGPLGSPDRPWAKKDDPVLLEQSDLVNIAAKYNKTTAQILIRYQIERGHIVIPKSITKSRIISNISVFDFTLTHKDVKDIDSFNCNGRLFPLLR